MYTVTYKIQTATVRLLFTILQRHPHWVSSYDALEGMTVLGFLSIQGPGSVSQLHYELLMAARLRAEGGI